MLDYSDDEMEAEAVRRRGLWPIASEVPPDSFRRADDGVPTAVPPVSRSMFRYPKERSSGLMMGESNSTHRNTFIVEDFFLKNSRHGFKNNVRIQDLDLNLKGGALLFAKSPVGPNFPDYSDNPDSFFNSMKFVVLFARFFAVMPLSGIRGSSYKNVRFKWLHFSTFYWTLSVTGIIFVLVCSVIHGLSHEIDAKSSGAVVFLVTALSTLFLMVNLAQNWRKLNREFAELELKFRKYGYPKRISFKFRVFTVFFLMGALVEHLLGKFRNAELAAGCSQRKDFLSLSETFFLNEYQPVFAYVSYTFGSGVLILLIHFYATVAWNFRDLFLGLIGWTIAERFQQVHGLLDKVHGQERPPSFWKEVREDYNNLTVLTKRVDVIIQKLMFLSMGDNLFFICIQLLLSLRKKLPPLQLFYFFWSFSFIVLRTGVVAFSAARINDESKEPKTVLYSVPQANYITEVRRFLTQLTTNDVALTGCGFFAITRSLILTIMGTVITYEIVLVQFSTDDAADGLKDNQTECSSLVLGQW